MEPKFLRSLVICSMDTKGEQAATRGVNNFFLDMHLTAKPLLGAAFLLLLLVNFARPNATTSSNAI